MNDASNDIRTSPAHELEDVTDSPYQGDEVIWYSGKEYQFGSHSHLAGEGFVSVDEMKPSTFSRKDRVWLFPAPFISFSKEKGLELWALCETRDIYELLMDDLQNVEEPYRSCLHSFICDIFAWWNKTHFKHHHWSQILYRSLVEGPVFARLLDEFRSRVLAYALEKNFLADPEWEFSEYGEDKDVFIFNGNTPLGLEVGDIFRPNCLFNWQPPSLNPADLMTRPVVFAGSILDRFRTHLRGFLSHPRFQFWDEIPFSEIQKSRNTKHSDGLWSKTQQSIPYATIRGKTRIVDIPREKKECRWACIEEASSVLSIQWIEQNVSSLIDGDHRNWTKRKPSTMVNLMWKAFKKPNTCSYCRDFKKEGLTKPRELLCLMMEELSVRFPESVCFKELKYFYRDWNLDEGIHGPTTRGHGLGMAVALTTLMQIVIDSMIRGSSGITPFEAGYVNDDAMVIIDKKDVHHWKTLDEKFCSELSLELKAKASFTSFSGAVICENYCSKRRRSLNFKNVFSETEFFILLKACNASHARSLAGSMQGRITKSKLDIIGQYWGSILFDGELNTPRGWGGWFKPSWRGVDISYVYHDRDTQQERKALFARSVCHLVTRPWDKSKISNRKFDGSLFSKIKNEKEFLSAEDWFEARLNPYENQRRWIAYESSLRKVFRNKNCKETDCKPWETHAADVLPPKWECHFVRSREVRVNRFLQFHNPYSSQRSDLERLESEKFGLSVDYPLKMSLSSSILWGTMSKDDVTNAFLRSEGISDATAGTREYMLWLAGKIPSRPDWGDVHIAPHPEAMSWINPFAVAMACDRFIKGYHSVIHPLGDNPERKKYYGRELTYQEWIKVGAVQPVDQILIAYVMRRDIDVDLDGIIRDLLYAPGFGRTLRRWGDGDNVFSIFQAWLRTMHDIKNQSARQRRVAKERTDRYLAIDEFYFEDFPPVEELVSASRSGTPTAVDSDDDFEYEVIDDIDDF